MQKLIAAFITATCFFSASYACAGLAFAQEPIPSPVHSAIERVNAVQSAIESTGDYVPLSESGNLAGLGIETHPSQLSPIVDLGDGTCVFYRIDGGTLLSHRFSKSDPTNIQSDEVFIVDEISAAVTDIQDGRFTSMNAIVDAQTDDYGAVHLWVADPDQEVTYALDVDPERNCVTTWYLGYWELPRPLDTAADVASEWANEDARIMAASQADDIVYVLAESENEGTTLAKYDEFGNLQTVTKADFEGNQGDTCRIDLREDGVMAISLFTEQPTSASTLQTTLFFNEDLQFLYRATTRSTGCSTWLDDGRYMTVGDRGGLSGESTQTLSLSVDSQASTSDYSLIAAQLNLPSTMSMPQTGDNSTLAYDITVPISANAATVASPTYNVASAPRTSIDAEAEPAAIEPVTSEPAIEESTAGESPTESDPAVVKPTAARPATEAEPAVSTMATESAANNSEDHGQAVQPLATTRTSNAKSGTDKVDNAIGRARDAMKGSDGAASTGSSSPSASPSGNSSSSTNSDEASTSTNPDDDAESNAPSNQNSDEQPEKQESSPVPQTGDIYPILIIAAVALLAAAAAFMVTTRRHGQHRKRLLF